MQQILNSLPQSFKEIQAIIALKSSRIGSASNTGNLDELALQMADMEFCYAALNKVSRSFAVVIQQLPPDLRNAVCVFYLTLRGLDTVEDDMSFSVDEKIKMLRSFYKNCNNEQFKLINIGDSEDYRHLLKHYYKVARAFNSLHPKFQEVITDITRKMGEGMAHYAENTLKTKEDYDVYCHYVAGLVGYGLSGLFSASQCEDGRLKDQLRISNAMGLMLQKTNIIRDYHEDMLQGRMFWPTDVWKQYANDFSWFSKNSTSQVSITCLNELVLDALKHLPDCLDYLRLLQNPSIFRFCAIPQVMAVATMADIYNNSNVFTGVVKIRKPLAAKLMMYTNTHKECFEAVEESLRIIKEKTTNDTPFGQDILEAIKKAQDCIHQPSNYNWEVPEEIAIEKIVFF